MPVSQQHTITERERERAMERGKERDDNGAGGVVF
jgi:hypothetical protein